VQDPNYKQPKKEVEPELTARLDKRVYEPGEQVKAYISSNVRPHPTLIVEEGLDIWGYRVVDSSSILYRFKTDKRMCPDAFISATQWVDRREVSVSRIVPLPDLDRQIEVTVKPDKTEYRPGQHAMVRVTTKDRHGRPVAADLSLAVVDEAIFALSPDITPDPYAHYWGQRPNHVYTSRSAPEEVAGGAFQMAGPPASVPTVRQRFEDTAFWSAAVRTGVDGTGIARFELPDNLTTWRATARAFTSETKAGAGKSSLLATRPLTLRLALPRQLTLGDRIQISGTVNNRTRHVQSVRTEFEGDPDSYSLMSDAYQTLTVPANGQAVVHWDVIVDGKAAGSRPANFGARAIGDPHVPDLNDALRMSVPVVPRGYRSMTAASAALDRTADIDVVLPADISLSGIKLQARVFVGIGAAMNGAAQEVLAAHRYGTPIAADQLIVASAIGPNSQRETVREDLALLSRSLNGMGWGWWENLPPDEVITAQVAHALAVAKAAKIQVPEVLLTVAATGSAGFYNQTQLWDHRALLVAGMYELGEPNAKRLLQEVVEHGSDVSPFARLRMAEALVESDPKAATSQLDLVLPLASRGPSSSYLPVGDGIGWTASSEASTAQLLKVLCALDREPDLQNELVRWLSSARQRYQCDDDQAAIASALKLYLVKHPESPSIGDVSMTVGGQRTVLPLSHVDASASVVVNGAALHPGRNTIRFERTEGGQAMVDVQVECYRPATNESHDGVRIARKIEVRNAAGVWTELDRKVRTGEPVRVTLSVWGDDIRDAVKVDEPVAAGFEFVDSETRYGIREEVRDGKMVHYLMNAGTPTVIRYYLRSESEGSLVASAPSAQYIRRPAALGHGFDQPLEVEQGH
jgi:hypothetical protein